MKKTKAQLRKENRERRFYGRTTIKAGQKVAWLSVQNKFGWSLGFALENRTIWLRNLRFTSRKEVEKAMEKGKLVFVALKNSK